LDLDVFSQPVQESTGGAVTSMNRSEIARTRWSDVEQMRSASLRDTRLEVSHVETSIRCTGLHVGGRVHVDIGSGSQPTAQTVWVVVGRPGVN
jgi:hypothetical protein